MASAFWVREQILLVEVMERGAQTVQSDMCRIKKKTMHSNSSAKEDDDFSHPSYILDLGTAEFHLLGPVKCALRGRRFSADDELKFSVREELRRLRKEFYGTRPQRHKQRSKKCVNNEKDMVVK